MEQNDGPNQGSLYRLDTDLKVHKMVENLSIPNGIVWTSNQCTMYHIDSTAQTITAYDYDSTTGNISNPAVALKFSTNMGYADGMTIDAEDKLWIAHWAGSRVTRWDPLKKECLMTIHLPVSKVTSCAFGGDNLTDLYITSASVEIDRTKEPLAGSIFVVRNVGKGVPAYDFLG